jgi:hypothetical protein
MNVRYLLLICSREIGAGQLFLNGCPSVVRVYSSRASVKHEPKILAWSISRYAAVLSGSGGCIDANCCCSRHHFDQACILRGDVSELDMLNTGEPDVLGACWPSVCYGQDTINGLGMARARLLSSELVDTGTEDWGADNHIDSIHWLDRMVRCPAGTHLARRAGRLASSIS